MGKIDEAMFQVLQHKDYFADVCNAVLFHGEQRIQPQRLQPMNIRQGVLERKRERKKKKKGKNGLSITDYRDAVFESELSIMSDDSFTYVILGIEHQSHVDISMPVRCMLYDLVQYKSQLNQLSESRSDEDTDVDFLTKLSPMDRLTPVVTIVLYTGDTPWDFPLSLRDILKIEEIPVELEDYIPNTKLPILDVKHSPSVDALHTGLQQVFTACRYSAKHQSEQLYQYISQEDLFKHMPTMLANLAITLVNINLGEFSKKEETNMCEAVEEWRRQDLARGRAEGLAEGLAEGIEKGLTEGIEKGTASSVRKLMAKLQMSMEEAFDLLELTEEEREGCAKLLAEQNAEGR